MLGTKTMRNLKGRLSGVDSNSGAAPQTSDSSCPTPLAGPVLVGAPATGSRKSGATPRLMRMEWIWEEKNRTPVLLVSGLMILAIALVDWLTTPYLSLGFLYLFPIMLAAGFLPRWAVVLLGIACAALTELFLTLNPASPSRRFGFELLALGGEYYDLFQLQTRTEQGLSIADARIQRRVTEAAE